MKKSLLIPVLFLFSAALLPATDWASIIKQVGPGVAKVNLTDANGAVISQGTGFATTKSDGSEVLVTNAHVARDAKYDETVSISVLFLFDDSSEKVYTGKIDQIDFYLDLCTIILNEPAPYILNLNEDSESSLMSEIAVVGYPLGRNFKATPGFIQAFQTIEKMGTMLDLSSVLAPGNSGGPVVDSLGNVIGVATAVIPGYNFNLALPIANLNTFLKGESNQIALTIKTDPAEARIFVDGDYKGETPFTLDLYNKEYQLRLEKDGYTVVENPIGPWPGNRPQDYNHSLQKKVIQNPLISIVTVPEGAEVFINNRFIGESPVSLNMTEGRIMRIRVKKRRYDESSEIYTVTAENEQTINITLQK